MPYCCNFCKNTFSQAIALARHITFYHGSKDAAAIARATSLLPIKLEKKKENTLKMCNDVKPSSFGDNYELKNTALSIKAFPIKIDHKNEARPIKVYNELKSSTVTSLPMKLENKNENILKLCNDVKVPLSGTSYESKTNAVSIKTLPTKIEHKNEDVLKLCKNIENPSFKASHESKNIIVPVTTYPKKLENKNGNVYKLFNNHHLLETRFTGDFF